MSGLGYDKNNPPTTMSTPTHTQPKGATTITPVVPQPKRRGRPSGTGAVVPGMAGRLTPEGRIRGGPDAPTQVVHGRSTMKTSFPSPGANPFIHSFDKFIEYWKSLSPDNLSRAKIHVYRNWPTIDRKQSNLNNLQTIELFEETEHDGKITESAECPFNAGAWEKEILHRYGSGDYKIMITERGITGAIAMGQIVGIRNMADYPPKLNIEELMVSDPANKSYVSYCRQHNISLPGDPGYKKEGEDPDETMNAQVIGQLVDRVTELSKPQPQPVSMDSQATSKGLEIVAQAAKLHGEIVKSANEHAAQVSGHQVDPLAMLDKVGEVISRNSSHNEGANSMVTMLMQQNADLAKEMREMQRQQMDMERLRIQAMEANKPQPKTLEQELEYFERLDAIINKRGRRKGDDDEDDEGNKKEKEGTIETVMRVAPMVMTGLTTLTTMAANMFANYVALKTNGQVTPPPVMTQPETGGVPATMDGNIQQPGQPEGTLPPEVVNFLHQIEGPFLVHFYGGPELNGATFAHHLINSDPIAGKQNYMVMRAQGPEQLTGMLSHYPPIWMRIGGLPQDVSRFMDEFMRYEEIKASWSAGVPDDFEDDDEEDDVEDGPTGATPPEKKIN